MSLSSVPDDTPNMNQHGGTTSITMKKIAHRVSKKGVDDYG